MKWMTKVKFAGIMCGLCLLTACGSSKPAAKVDAESNVTKGAKAEGDVKVNADADELDVYGDVKVNKTQEIIIDFPATVTEVYVKDGDTVKKGDKLLSLDLEDYKLQIKTKESEIHIDEINLQKLKASRNPQMLEADRIREELSIKQNYVATGKDPDLEPFQNSLSILEQAVVMAKNQYVANKQLFEINCLSKEELKQSEQNLKNKEKEKQDALTAIEKIKTNRQIEVNALSTQLKSTEVQSGNTDQQKSSDIKALELKIETSKLVLTSMKNKLNKPYIKGNDLIAPEDNIVIYDINCMKGSEIDGSVGSILKAMYHDTIYVTADIPEESLNFVKVGDQAFVELADETQDKEISGRISGISNRAVLKDGDTIVEAVISVEQGKELLKPGLTADIKLLHNR